MQLKSFLSHVRAEYQAWVPLGLSDAWLPISPPCHSMCL